MSWWVLTHVDVEGPALIGTIMAERGIENTVAAADGRRILETFFDEVS